MQALVSSPIGRLRVISLLEGISFLVLLTFSVLKRSSDWELGVQIMGPVHGALFVLYVLAALVVRGVLNWPTPTTVKVVVAAVLPIAPFFVERWLRSQEQPVTR